MWLGGSARIAGKIDDFITSVRLDSASLKGVRDGLYILKNLALISQVSLFAIRVNLLHP